MTHSNHTASASVPQTPEGWAAERHASAALQAEYPTAAGYVAVKRRQAEPDAAGGAMGTKSGTAPSTPAAGAAEGWTAEWNASAKLQDEYPTAAGYVAVMRRKAA